MASWQFNDAEDGALQGLSRLAQVIYLRGLRPRMDYRTGLVGDCRARGITRDSLAVVGEFVPGACSTRLRARPTPSQVRAALAELVRAELIERPEGFSPRWLVFRLLQATLHSSAQNMSDRSTTDEQPRESDRTKSSSDAVSGDGSTDEQPRKPGVSAGRATSLQGQGQEILNTDTPLPPDGLGSAQAREEEVLQGGECDFLAAEQIEWLRGHAGARAAWGRYLHHLSDGRPHRVAMARRRALVVELMRLCAEHGCRPADLLDEQVRRGWKRLDVPADWMANNGGYGNGRKNSTGGSTVSGGRAGERSGAGPGGEQGDGWESAIQRLDDPRLPEWMRQADPADELGEAAADQGRGTQGAGRGGCEAAPGARGEGGSGLH